MAHHILTTFVAVWASGNFYLWSLKQEPQVLLLESLGDGSYCLSAYVLACHAAGEIAQAGAAP